MNMLKIVARHFLQIEQGHFRALRRVFVTGTVTMLLAALFIGVWRPSKGGFEAPAPHQVPSSPNAASLRFAMVHDVIHERFAKRGRAYYEARNKQVRTKLDLANHRGDTPHDRYALLDDLAVGLHAVGRSDEASVLMRDKLSEQLSNRAPLVSLYTTCANLGTFILFANLQNALQGDNKAVEQFKEGLVYVRQAIEINPDAHFGREKWQAAFMEFFLAALEKPTLLNCYDMLGNDLKHDLPYERPSAVFQMHSASVFYRDFGKTAKQAMLDTDKSKYDLRYFVRKIGSEGKWSNEVASTHKYSVPFDEPVLGVIGMWREGGGANPHFCLFLGETMLRVGQRHIAWCAYERGILLADSFWPDEAIRKQFVAHCQARQQLIAASISGADQAQWRKEFAAELRFGQGYQTAYQAYEEKRLGEGADLDDPSFDDAFHREHGTIATSPGREDYVLVEEPTTLSWRFAAGPLLIGALAALLVAMCLRRPAKAADGQMASQRT